MEDAACGRDGDLLMAKMNEVAGWVGADASAVDGEITSVSSIEAATGSSVVFAVDAAALKAALESKAGVILAGKALKLDEMNPDARVWKVADPRYAFALIAGRLKGKGFEAGIHASAVVGEGVAIGEGTSIGPRVVIGDGVQIGRDCHIWPGSRSIRRRCWATASWCRRVRCWDRPGLGMRVMRRPASM